jgi:hypothetical protein
VVSVTAPAAGATVSGSAVSVTANASDNVAISGVQFRLDGAALGAEDTTAPYAITWNTTSLANGSYTLTAVARDAAANTTTSTPVGVTVTNSTQPPPAGLVAAYGFEEPTGTTATDSAGTNTGTINGATRTTSGKNGSALTFNGTTNTVTIPDANPLDLTTGMTLEAWVKPTASANWRTILLKEQPGDLVYGLYASQGAGEIGGHIFTTSDLWTNTTSALPLNAWSHVSATYDGTTLRLYLNGSQVATRAIAGPIKTSTGVLRIGGNAIWGEYFVGTIDDVRVYNRALTAAEVVADQSRPAP